MGETKEVQDEARVTHDEEELLGSNSVRLCLSRFEVLFLSDVGHESDDFESLVDEPGENA